MIAVAYERWSLTIDSNYRTVLGKNLVFWVGLVDRLREAIAHGSSTVIMKNADIYKSTINNSLTP